MLHYNQDEKKTLVDILAGTDLFLNNHLIRGLNELFQLKQKEATGLCVHKYNNKDFFLIIKLIFQTARLLTCMYIHI